MDKKSVRRRSRSICSAFSNARSVSLRKGIESILTDPSVELCLSPEEKERKRLRQKIRMLNPISIGKAVETMQSPRHKGRKHKLRPRRNSLTVSGGPQVSHSSAPENTRKVLEACLLIQRFWRRRKQKKITKQKFVIEKSRRKFNGDTIILPKASIPLRIRHLSNRRKTGSDAQLMHFIRIAKMNDLKSLQDCIHRISSQVLNGTDAKGNTALFYACKNGNLIYARHLVRAGCKLNIQCEDKNTELHAACIAGNSALVCYLIRNGSLLRVRNKDAYTPLDLAHQNIAKKFEFKELKGNAPDDNEVLQKLISSRFIKSKSISFTECDEEPTYSVDLSIRKSSDFTIREFAPLFRSTFM